MYEVRFMSTAAMVLLVVGGHADLERTSAEGQGQQYRHAQEHRRGRDGLLHKGWTYLSPIDEQKFEALLDQPQPSRMSSRST